MNKKTIKMINIVEKIDKNEFEDFISILKAANFSQEEINMLIKARADKDKKISIKSSKDDKDLVGKLYKAEFNKILYIINNKELIDKVGGLKVIFYGKTGTGKTTFIQKIIKHLVDTNEYEYREMNYERLISSKMGQTQINFINLSEEIKMYSEKKKQLIFIDELDSIITNRNSVNDIGEHSRVVATFIKFLDSLPKNAILLTATNHYAKIDDSIIRRFNIKLEGKELSYKEFVRYIKHEMNMPVNQFTTFGNENRITNTFRISDVDDFIKNYEIEKIINNNKIKPFEFFIKYFYKSIDFENYKLSSRTYKKIAGDDE